MWMKSSWSAVIRMRDRTVRQRLNTIDLLEAVYKVLNDCGCEEGDEQDDDGELNEKYSGMEMVKSTSTTFTTAIDSVIKRSILRKHKNDHGDDNDQKMAGVDKHDHEYFHECDVPLPAPQSQAHETNSDSEIDKEHKAGQINLEHDSKKRQVVNQKKRSNLDKCKNCKQQVE